MKAKEFRRMGDEDVPAPTKGPGYRKFRKMELERKALISCSRCPFNKGENGKRKPKHRSWKTERKTKFKYKEVAQDVRLLAQEVDLIGCQLQAILWFTWKRINRAVYNPNLNLFGDHWGLDVDVTKIKPFKVV